MESCLVRFYELEVVYVQFYVTYEWDVVSRRDEFGVFLLLYLFFLLHSAKVPCMM